MSDIKSWVSEADLAGMGVTFTHSNPLLNLPRLRCICFIFSKLKSLNQKKDAVEELDLVSFYSQGDFSDITSGKTTAHEKAKAFIMAHGRHGKVRFEDFVDLYLSKSLHASDDRIFCVETLQEWQFQEKAFISFYGGKAYEGSFRTGSPTAPKIQKKRGPSFLRQSVLRENGLANGRSKSPARATMGNDGTKWNSVVQAVAAANLKKKAHGSIAISPGVADSGSEQETSQRDTASPTNVDSSNSPPSGHFESLRLQSEKEGATTDSMGLPMSEHGTNSTPLTTMVVVDSYSLDDILRNARKIMSEVKQITATSISINTNSIHTANGSSDALSAQSPLMKSPTPPTISTQTTVKESITPTFGVSLPMLETKSAVPLMINFVDAMSSVLQPSDETASSPVNDNHIKASSSGAGNGASNDSSARVNTRASTIVRTTTSAEASICTSASARSPLMRGTSGDTSGLVSKVTLVVANLHKALLEQREALRQQQRQMDEQLEAIVDIQKYLSEL